MKTFTLPELPYDFNALEPGISAETLQYHYKKHHAGYVEKLNDLIDGTRLEGKSLEEVITSQPVGKIFNNAAQVWNHTFYWHSMTPERGQKPSPEVAERINNSFGSRKQFYREFAEAATGQFGSGWAWLVLDSTTGGLRVMSTANADSPLKSGYTPLLVCDVWEHAYYIDYRNDRSMYVEKFIQLINWDFIEDNLSRDVETEMTKQEIFD